MSGKYKKINLFHFTKYSKTEPRFKKMLEDFPWNIPKQRHSMTDINLEYLEYSPEIPVMWKGALFYEVSLKIFQKLPEQLFLKTSLTERDCSWWFIPWPCNEFYSLKSFDSQCSPLSPKTFKPYQKILSLVST